MQDRTDDNRSGSLTILTRSFAASSAFAEFPLSSDTSEGSMAPGADFQRTHRSSPVPALCIISAICEQICCRFAVAEISAARTAPGPCTFDSLPYLTLFAARRVWCKYRSSASLPSDLQSAGVTEMTDPHSRVDAFSMVEHAAWTAAAPRAGTI